MHLKKASLLTIIGLSCSFAIRTSGTLFPHIFRNLLIVHISVVVHLCASLALIYFFLSFYRFYLHEEQRTLKMVAMLAVAGSFASLALHIKHTFIVFNVSVLPLFFMHHSIDAIVPLVSSTTVVLFFIIYHREMPHQERERLGESAKSAIIGFSLYTSIHAIVLFNYLSFRELRWISQFSNNIALGILIILAFAFIAVFYFFLTFYRFINEVISLEQES